MKEEKSMELYYKRREKDNKTNKMIFFFLFFHGVFRNIKIMKDVERERKNRSIEK